MQNKNFILQVHLEALLYTCPLTALMMDQCKRFSDKGVVAKFVGEAMTDKNVIKEVLEGRVQLLYITTKSIILNRLYRNMLLSPVYTEKLAALVIDEAHCVKFWGDQFRQTLALIGDLRNLIPSNVNYWP